MNLLVEMLVLLALLVVAAVLLWDLTRPWRRARRGREHLDELALEGDDREEEAPEPGRWPRLTRRLETAGLPVGPVVFLAALALLLAAVFLLLLWWVPAIPLLALFGAALAVYVVWVATGELARARARRFERDLVDAVDFMVSALQAGENPMQALASSATTVGGAVRRELEEVVHRLDLGLGIRAAVARMRRRYESEGVRLFTQTLVIKWRAGGDLAPVLRQVAAIMRERIYLTMRLRTELTGVQLAGLGVALLPYVLIPVYIWIRPDWSAALAHHPLGMPLIMVAVSLQLLGLLWLRRILSIEL